MAGRCSCQSRVLVNETDRVCRSSVQVSEWELTTAAVISSSNEEGLFSRSRKMAPSHVRIGFFFVSNH